MNNEEEDCIAQTKQSLEVPLWYVILDCLLFRINLVTFYMHIHGILYRN